MNREKTGITLIELLMVMGIIVVLSAFLLPAVNMVRLMAKEAEQVAQFNTINLALNAYKNDFGDYPDSKRNPDDLFYMGTQRLTEALVGWDLLGFHPDSAWRSDGRNKDGSEQVYRWPLEPLIDPDDKRNMEKRKGPYLELATANVFRLGESKPGLQDGLYEDPSPFADWTYVLCDVFGIKRVSLLNPDDRIVGIVNAGTPILYYKANTSSNTMIGTLDPANRIYNVRDNVGLYRQSHLKKPGEPHPLSEEESLFYNQGSVPYNYDYKIIDPKVKSYLWPHRPDSYILISAGPDGFYGNQDDITNF